MTSPLLAFQGDFDPRAFAFQDLAAECKDERFDIGKYAGRLSRWTSSRVTLCGGDYYLTSSPSFCEEERLVRSTQQCLWILHVRLHLCYPRAERDEREIALHLSGLLA